MALHTPLLALALLQLLLQHAATIGAESVSIDAGITERTRCLAQPGLICVLSATSISRVEGVVRFEAVYQPRRSGRRCVTRVSAHVRYLRSKAHGFHIHTYGDMSAADGSSTGGHFSNPRGSPRAHGYPGSHQRHWGDLGNIFADSRGVASLSRIDSVIKLRGIVGRGMTLHEAADRGPGFQPSGSAGARIAFCVIGYANPSAMSGR